MSKTATIKLRLTEAEKTAWEAQATADGVSLSSLIRRRMNHPVVRADGELVPASRSVELLDDVRVLNLDEGVPQPFVLKAGDALEALARRREECDHGRPQYVFCPTCDGA